MGKEPKEPVLAAHVIASTRRPGELSLRLAPEDGSWTPLIRALREAGFKPGDEILIVRVGRTEPA